MRRKAVSVISEAWLPVFPQLTKVWKEVPHFCHSLFPYFSALCKEVVLLVVKAVYVLLRNINQIASILSPQDLWGFCFGVCLFVFKMKLENILTVADCRCEEKEAPLLL